MRQLRPGGDALVQPRVEPRTRRHPSPHLLGEAGAARPWSAERGEREDITLIVGDPEWIFRNKGKPGVPTRFDALVVVPMYQVMWIFFNIMGGAICFQEFAKMSTTNNRRSDG